MKKILVSAVISSWVLSACGETEMPSPPALIGTWQYKFIDGTGKVLDQGAIVIADEFAKNNVWASLGAYQSISLDNVEGEMRFINRYVDGVFKIEALFLHKKEDESIYLEAIDDDRRFNGSGVHLIFKGRAKMYDPDGESKVLTGNLTIARTKLEIPSIVNKMNIKR